MPYVRFSLMRPKNGEEARVRDLLDRLVEFYSQQPGYIDGYRLEPTEADGLLGRMGVWESEQDATRAAQTEYDLALRSQLNMSVAEHTEHSFQGVERKP
jgi:heme-degrading monooxygenase HmoA